MHNLRLVKASLHLTTAITSTTTYTHGDAKYHIFKVTYFMKNLGNISVAYFIKFFKT